MKKLFFGIFVASASIALFAQQSSRGSTVQSTTQNQTSTSGGTASGATATGQPPLQATQGGDFWDGDEPGLASLILHPFARKEYVRRQLRPLQDRVNELDALAASDKQKINDVDAGSRRGIQLASDRASQADQHAGDAEGKSQRAQASASQAQTRLTSDEEVVSNLDAYKSLTQIEIRFHTGQTQLSKNDQRALDQMTKPLKNEHGYIIEMYGFANGRGQTAIATSRRFSDVVSTYLMRNCDVPLYRIYALPLGNASVASAGGPKAGNSTGNRVELRVLKNDLDQVASSPADTSPK